MSDLFTERNSDLMPGTPPYDGGSIVNLSVPNPSGPPPYNSRGARKADLLQPAYVAMTVNTALLSAQSGSVVHNHGATGSAQAQLPPAIAPLEFEFTVLTAEAFGPQTVGSDLIVSDVFSGASLTCAVIGSNLKLRCIINGQWIVAYATGAWG